jgi:hypothetical protein
MDLPITRPSMMCYADEIEFPEFLKDLSAKKHNGFIRITSGSDEGFIFFKKGKEIAASYDRHSRVDAIEKIKDAMDDNKTLIEIFNVRLSQIDFFMDMNKPYIIGSDAYDLIDELKRSKEVNNTEPELAPEPKAVPKPKPVSEAIRESEIVSTPVKPIKTEAIEEKLISESVLPPVKDYTESENLPETETVNPKPVSNSGTVKEGVPENNDSGTIKEPLNETKPVDEPLGESILEPVKSESEIIEPSAAVSSTDTPADENLNSTLESSEINQNETKSKEELEDAEMPPMDRSELMKKYGIKEIQEEDVDNILESYKGGSISDEDVEKIELTLMNKIKKSILAIHKIKGAEVMVFLDNVDGLSGKVNIIIESETKGFLSRLMGDSKDINLERQIIDISQIEIRKSFRKYPEIVDKFEVNVEIG